MSKLIDKFVKILNHNFNSLIWSCLPFMSAFVVYLITDGLNNELVMQWFFYVLSITLIGTVIQGLQNGYYSLGTQSIFRGENPILFRISIILAIIITLVCLFCAVMLTIYT